MALNHGNHGNLGKFGGIHCDKQGVSFLKNLDFTRSPWKLEVQRVRWGLFVENT
jgi:hypothetical protein